MGPVGKSLLSAPFFKLYNGGVYFFGGMIPKYNPKTSSKAWHHFEDQKPPLLKSTIHVSKYTFRPMDPMSH